MPDPAPIPFAEWLESLRAELADAQRAGRDSDLRLQVDKVELDLEVQSTWETGAKGGVKFWVVDAGADGRWKSGLTQHLKLSLTPFSADGEPLAVRDEMDQPPA
jgi:Trypsin-co-occurring domain 2